MYASDRVRRAGEEQAARALRLALHRRAVVMALLATWPADPGRRTRAEWTALREVLRSLWHSRGLDPDIGRRLPTLLRATGLCEVEANGRAGIDGAGHPYRRLILTFAERFRERILAARLTRPDELDALVAAVDRHLADPGTVVVRAMTVQAWGRVAGRAGRRS